MSHENDITVYRDRAYLNMIAATCHLHARDFYEQMHRMRCSPVDKAFVVLHCVRTEDAASAWQVFLVPRNSIEQLPLHPNDARAIRERFEGLEAGQLPLIVASGYPTVAETLASNNVSCTSLSADSDSKASAILEQSAAECTEDARTLGRVTDHIWANGIQTALQHPVVFQ